MAQSRSKDTTNHVCTICKNVEDSNHSHYRITNTLRYSDNRDLTIRVCSARCLFRYKLQSEAVFRCGFDPYNGKLTNEQHLIFTDIMSSLRLQFDYINDLRNACEFAIERGWPPGSYPKPNYDQLKNDLQSRDGESLSQEA